MTQRAALVLAAAFVVVAAAACGSGSTPSAQPANSQAVSDSDFAHIPGQLPAQPPGVPGAAMAPVGACVSLTGRSTSASLKLVDCSSPSNGYMVVQRVATPEQCVRDVDQKFYMNLEEGQFTACLDYAWRPDDCLSIAKLTASRVACDDKSIENREKPIRVILNSVSASDCPSGGFPHPERRFTICTETQR